LIQALLGDPSLRVSTKLWAMHTLHRYRDGVGIRRGHSFGRHLSYDQTVRNLWRQKDIGAFANRFEADVPPHGVLLISVHDPTVH
jgi:hypothetical protein